MESIKPGIFLIITSLLIFSAGCDNEADRLSHEEEMLRKAAEKEVVQPEKEVSMLQRDYKLLSEESRIEIALPWSREDEIIGFMPLGETLYHEPPGHPGFDFGWDHKAIVRSSADGKVTNILPVPEDKDGNWIVEITSGEYIISYNFLEDISIALGDDVKKGQPIGHPASKDAMNYVIHWDIRPDVKTEIITPQTLCPLTYFDSGSRQTLEAIHAKSTWVYKDQFPKICNGYYDGLDSFLGLYNRSFSPSGDLIKPNGDLIRKFS